MELEAPPIPLLGEVREARAAWDRDTWDPRLPAAYRKVLRTFAQLQSSGAETGQIWHELADDALRFLGGQGDQWSIGLSAYNHWRLGPFLGISNEGSGATVIAAAALRSPKAIALGKRRNAVGVGVAVDAERLSSAGEVPAGPNDMSEVWRGCAGRLLTTTNVGSRVNVRLYKSAPVIDIESGNVEVAKAAIDVAIRPFREAPGGPRPLQVSVRFAAGASGQPTILRCLNQHIRESQGKWHKLYPLALHLDLPGPVEAVELIEQGIATAISARISFISIAGETSIAASESISLPGLLGLVAPAALEGLIASAKAAGVRLVPANRIDPDAVMHDIWSALNSARSFGLNMGKYGLFPLTLEQSNRVVRRIQHWFKDWTAAPVFYVDQGILTSERLYAGETVVPGIKLWLKMVATHGVHLVLIDTVDKARGWKLLKENGDPKGLLTLEQVAEIEAFGAKLGVNILWAGGLSVKQSRLLAAFGVFGIYVTSSISTPVAVSGLYIDDPGLAAARTPTFEGVLALKLQIDAGFLSARLSALKDLASRSLAAAIDDAVDDDERLAAVLVRAWRQWWKMMPPHPVRKGK
ncbi:hypothetical protein [Microvirga lotononidis]|uniref:Uncharacterized protein n=1 Tax=Microvirga lotononidis TaxID=864069 RepID=I4Z4M1_9HYPH|nr:hypothetical protein [Microvirga lotononidis]EIM31163.1 hypothetical protein MicloDRAFT_00001530 [Microvirga lotononidis]WQO30446.1 hypothetical protein U0023_23605 [Microvirga lotononidis]